MRKDNIVLLHLSDIHFCKEVSDTNLDLDKDLRNELERDALSLKQKLGRLDGILISGDIAYRGSEDEYTIAGKWLEDLCDKLECRRDYVWTVPGNHDIDRSLIDKSGMLKVCHEKIREALPHTIDRHIKSLFYDDETSSSALLKPLQNYNEFADRFGCAVEPKKLYWTDDIKLNDGSLLRLIGLNSTLISDSLDDERNRLVLSSFQINLPTLDCVEYITLCHHPLDWLRDSDEVKDKLDKRARIKLFGHKHYHKIDDSNNSLKITSGAMHPEREEQNWQPRYNFLTLTVELEDRKRSLIVEVYPRVWKDYEFIPDFDKRGDEKQSYIYPLEACSPEDGDKTELTSTESTLDIKPGDLSLEKEQVEEDEGFINPFRNLTYNFFRLPYFSRLKIALNLGLFNDEDRKLKDSEMFREILQRSKANNMLSDLWESIEETNGNEKKADNPFKK